MPERLRFCFLALYAAGPAVALLALLRRRGQLSASKVRAAGWRWYVPSVLVPVEWVLPPVLIVLGLGEVPVAWLPVRLLGLAAGLGGAAVLIWAAAVLGRFLVHEAAVFPDHALVTRGPYRFVRHPIYAGYLALLLGTGLGMLNVWLLLFWPISLGGILLQAGAEEHLLARKFGATYQGYATRTGRLIPRLWVRPG
jgi:protein-S-isoprenylcysteine O-methyltransferase